MSLERFDLTDLLYDKYKFIFNDTTHGLCVTNLTSVRAVSSQKELVVLLTQIAKPAYRTTKYFEK